MKRIVFYILIVLTISCKSQQNKIPDDFDYGKIVDNTYINDFFDLKVTYNPEWVVQSDEQVKYLTEIGEELVASDNKNLKKIIKAAEVNTAYLLTIFKHEFGAPVDFNPSFMLVAENTKMMPGIKSGSDYLFHARNLLEQSDVDYLFEEDLSTHHIGNSNFDVLKANLIRADLTIQQEYMSTVKNGFSLSIIVTYTSEEEKEELYQVLNDIKF